MVLALEKKWIWDSWYVHDGSQWHCFFLQADKALIDPDLRHFNVSQGHAVGTDLVHWEHKGTMFAPAKSPAWDDYTTWTGSVLRGADGLWHLFYTGSCRAEGGLKQRIGHAVGVICITGNGCTVACVWTSTNATKNTPPTNGMTAPAATLG